MVILDIKKPKMCIWYEDGQDCKCPLLDDNDCCRGQGNEANSAANDWDDLMKGCPIKGEISKIELMHLLSVIHEEERAFAARNIAAESEADADYQLSVLMQEYCERYEPTYNSEDGSM